MKNGKKLIAAEAGGGDKEQGAILAISACFKSP